MCVGFALLCAVAGIGLLGGGRTRMSFGDMFCMPLWIISLDGEVLKYGITVNKFCFMYTCTVLLLQLLLFALNAEQILF